MNAEHSATIIL